MPPSARFCVGVLAQRLLVESRGADDDVHSGVEAIGGVGERGLGRGEVDDDVGLAEVLGERRLQRRVGSPRQVHVGRALDRFADGLPHPARGARDDYADHTRAASAGGDELL